ncbi:hypothetical protein QQX09_04475 [Demequina sp. SYSU T00192]|uniref:Uncharacterized protein n=1 Tax=Demequina litoralis TaxID=3051660 RepID=A0ABT8G7I7_9MICO|nr:hypothetical protein [Demequina sp. SYSU T00192]MDN4475112.1 hypothetical protein [Demequina sp. SYSU T00192]
MATWKHVSTYLTKELRAQPIDKARLAIELPPTTEGAAPISLVAVHAAGEDPTAEQVILRVVVGPANSLDLDTALSIAGTSSRGGLVTAGQTVLLTHSFLLAPLTAAEAQGTAGVSIAHLAGVLEQIRAASAAG